MISYKLFNKDCRSMIELPDNSIHVVCTSPPYLGLRKYSGDQDLIWGDTHCQHEWNALLKHRSTGGPQVPQTKWESNISVVEAQRDTVSNFCSLCGAWRGAFGLEPDPRLYIQHSVEILREIRRVLRPDGVVFWNIGDSYASGKGSCFNPGGGNMSWKSWNDRKGIYNTKRLNKSDLDKCGLKPLDLCLIPERLAIALQLDGWWVRSIIIWHKANPMPESVNGWRWERHKIKVKVPKKPIETKADRPLESPNHPYRGDGWETQALEGREPTEYKDCPGCPKCSPNEGYVLRKGSWRPTDSYEQILMLTKSSSYYCDAEAVREIYTEPLNRWGGPTLKRETAKTSQYKDEVLKLSPSSALRAGAQIRPNENGRNLRNVWSFPTVPYPGAHFAVFPEKLPELCIKAATPEVGVCAKCGAPWARVIETHYDKNRPSAGDDKRSRNEDRLSQARGHGGWQGNNLLRNDTTLGWCPTCSCNCAEKVPATVLDPFAGAGTTLLVAIKLGRNAVGYELSSHYCDMIKKRVNNVQIKYS